MSTIKSVALTSLLLLAAKVQAQINIPVSDVSLDISPLSNAYSVSLSLGGTTRTVRVDPFKIATTGISGAGATAAELATIKSTALWFCLDPLQTIYYNGSGVSGNLVYQSTDPANFNKYNDSVVADGGGLNSFELTDLGKLFAANYVAASSNTLMASALQIAIWEVANESNTSSKAGSYALTGGSAGNFKITSGDSTLLSTAQTMLNNIASAPALSKGALDFLIDGSYTNAATRDTVLVQDLLGWAPPIPESSNFATGALGLLGLAVVAKLRSRKPKQA